ncbi:WD40 repeat-like protein [Venustampulla echinocandica]|uniref:WD40 repeat-like protein n=1 Tax=Venustampulla echinocandica TaxID=2656787 RepID=A0A370TB38_9HELO|nr:WD40 repeat-like protein [Venustampulla echinocandica]RDL31142.1 WD40 repeat-like protein [Venustampulla echinocandica]
MDIHRCRFVHYPPSTINALAFSHSHIPDDRQTTPPRLAVGRANGDIEIWNPLNGSWLQEMVIRGGKDRSIDGLVWIQDPDEEVHGTTIIGKSRLFSIGYTTTVTEWDLEKGRPLRQASGTHGDIWCLAAQPPLAPVKDKKNAATTGQWQGQHLIAGCTDGALVLYSTKDEDLQLQRVLIRPSSKKAKVISVTFQDRNIVVAGCSDSTIRIYDIRNGTAIRSMSLGQGPVGGPKEIIVWSVKTLKDGTIVSGDSTGELRIWDGKTYTLKQRMKSHRQDILSLAINSDGSSIISGGMDRRTVVYKQAGKAKRWAEVSHRRYHNHDVKAMASFEGRGMSVVVSGGPDASPTVLPLNQFGFENQRALPFLPQESIIQSAPRKRLMMSWWEREVYIWRLGKLGKPHAHSEDADEEFASRNRKLVAKILIKGEANITSASLSTDGDLLAVATALDVKVFQLRARRPDDGDGLKISKVTVPATLSSGARLVQFSPDGKWLSIVRPDSQIAVGRIISSGSSSASSITILPRLLKLGRIDRHIEKSILLGGLGSYDRTVTQAAFSWDSKILAVSDLAGYIDTFVLSGHEDLKGTDAIEDEDAASSSESSDSDSDSDSESEEESKPKTACGQHWARNPSATLIPRLPSAPVVLSFRPTRKPSQRKLTNGATPHDPSSAGEDGLLVVTATAEIFEFEVLKGGLSAWSRRNPTAVFPEEFRKNRDQAKGCLWHITESEQRVWLYGVGWLWMFDISVDFPSPTTTSTSTDESGVVAATPSKKRKRQQGKEPSTGAGSAIPDHELGTGISRKTQRFVHDELLVNHDINNTSSSDAMDVDGEDEHSTALEQLRREKQDQHQQQEGADKAGHWHTYKYRPILGMVVIGGDDEDAGEADGKTGLLEVAVVERPIWEVDLPPRWDGDQEWEKSGLDSL